MSTASTNTKGSPLPGDEEAELRHLFHRLNNELGIILSHAELLETKVAEETNRTRASQVVASVLDALATAREIRQRTVVAAR